MVLMRTSVLGIGGRAEGGGRGRGPALGGMLLLRKMGMRRCCASIAIWGLRSLLGGGVIPLEMISLGVAVVLALLDGSGLTMTMCSSGTFMSPQIRIRWMTGSGVTVCDLASATLLPVVTVALSAAVLLMIGLRLPTLSTAVEDRSRQPPTARTRIV